MVRKNTELYKIQQKIFCEAYCADSYLKTMDGYISKYDSTWITSESIRNTLECMIHEMGWYADYVRYCEKEKSLAAQALPTV